MKTKRIVVSLLAGIFGAGAAAGLTACGEREEYREGYDNLTVYMQSGAEYESSDKDSVWRAIEEATKTTLKYTGPSSDYFIRR